nr:MAG TPA: hypothetical protein [Bacteriophage sp.]
MHTILNPEWFITTLSPLSHLFLDDLFLYLNILNLLSYVG